MMMKKSLTWFLLLTMLLMCFAGCGAQSMQSSASEPVSAAEVSEESEPSAGEAPALEAPEAEASEESAPADEVSTEEPEEPMEVQGPDYPLVEEPTTLSMWNQLNPWTSSFMLTLDEHPGYQRAEEITGVHIEFTSASFWEAETQFQLMAASGDYSDIIDGATQMYTGGAAGAIDDDFVLDLTDLIEEYAPYYTARRNADPEVLRESMLDDGRIACFHSIRDLDNYVYPGNGLLIRKDLLDQVGMEIPETYDQLHDVLTAFKDQCGLAAPLYMYPTGVFQDNLLAAGFDVAIMTQSGMHQTMPFYQLDGAVHYGIVEEGFREYITMMHQWCEEGLISRDFPSNTDPHAPEYTTQMAQGNAGVFMGSNTAIAATVEAGQASVPGYDLVPMSDVTKEPGGVTHLGNYFSHTGAPGVAISTACDDVPLALQWCDFWFSDQGILLANWGIEGESYELGADGQPHFTEIMTNDPNYSLMEMTGKYCVYTTTVETTLSFDSALPMLEQYPEIAVDAVSVWADGKDGEYELPERMSMTAEEKSEFNGYYSDMETLVAESIPKFINGDRPLSELDNFMATVGSMGAEQCIAIKQAALDRFNER